MICANIKCGINFIPINKNQKYCSKKCFIYIYKRKEHVIIQQRKDHKNHRINIKTKFIELYGNECINCGENNRIFLTLDHINNDGFKDRKARLGSISGYRKAIKEFRPDLYQVLCYNCNCAKRLNNGKVLPHLSAVKLINNLNLPIDIQNGLM